jgi:HlyD family secretion protein
MKRYVKSALKLLVIAMIGGVIGYIFFFYPISVKSVKVSEDAIIAEAMGTGTLEARVRATISPKISGRIAQILVDQGDKASKGQILATLDDKDLLQQVEIAKAELDLAQAGVERAAAEVSRAEAIDKNAKASFARYSRLTDTQAVSAKEVDQAKEDLDVAQAELNRAHSAKIEAEKQVAKAQASLRYYQERLADTKIVAPFDGLITRRTRDPGDIVVPGGMILEMVYLDPLWISAWVDETMLNKLQLDQPCRIIFRSDPDTELRGKVARIAPQTDRETREVLVDVVLDELPKTWAIGQRAEVFIEIARKDKTLTLPQNTIVWQQAQPGVFVIENGKTNWVKVNLGLQGKGKAEILQGLHLGQTVLVPGPELPRNGRAVKITP